MTKKKASYSTEFKNEGARNQMDTLRKAIM